MEAAIPPVVFLGGHGSTAAARAAVESSLRHALPGVAVRSLGGPVALGDGASAWWSDELEADAWPALVALLDSAVGALGLADTPIVVAGFSQGGAAALAWASAPGRRQPLAAVVCVAGFLPGAVGAGAPVLAPPVLVVIPEVDEVVDPFLGGVAARALAKAGFAVTLLEVEGGHEWTPLISAAVAGWLAEPH